MDYNYKNTSWDIYLRANEMLVKIYFDELRKVVFHEVKTGSCPLIDQLIVLPLNSGRSRSFLSRGEQEIPVLVYFAIDQALSALETGGNFPNLDNNLQLNASTIYNWRHLNTMKPNEKKAIMSLELLQHFADRYKKLCAYFKKVAPTSPSYHSSTAVSDKIGPKEVDPILENAKAEAAKITRTAEDEADQIRLAAQDEAARIKKIAEDEANQIRLAAQKDAERIKRTAEDDADGIRQAAQEQATADAERNVAALTQQKLSGYIQNLRRQWEDEYRERDKERADTSALAATLKENACTVSTTVGANLNRGLDQLQEQINQLRSNVTLDLQQWRSSLYQCEYGNLVNFYNTLNGYANSFEREYREAECSGTVPDELKKILGEHSRKLNRLRGNLIGAMEPMGLRLFTPQKGDLFDSYYHTTNEDEDDDVFLNREIEQCLKPGIERVVNNREVAVLLRASVEVRKD